MDTRGQATTYRPVWSMLHRTVLLALAVLLGTAGGVVGAAGPADEAARFIVTGAVDAPTTYTVGAIEELVARGELAQRTVSVQYASSGGVESRTETGVLLVDLLERAQPQLDPANKNDELRLWVNVTAADGYQATLAYGEISPGFGNRPVLLATVQDGQSLAIEGPRLVVPGDVKGGRYVSAVTRITVGHTTPPADSPSSVLPCSFSLDGPIDHPDMYATASLRQLPAHTVTDSFVSGSGEQTHTWTGALLSDFLATTELLTPDGVKNASLRYYVTVTASDGYQATVSLGEIDPGFGNRPVLLAYTEDGEELPRPRLVVPGDVKGGRYVSDVTNLEIHTTDDALS